VNTVTVKVPGQFWNWFSGSAVGQGQVVGWGVGGEVAWEATRTARHVKAGRGYYLLMTFPATDDGQAGVKVLLEYAEDCISLNTDGGSEPDHSELAGARKVAERCRAALAAWPSA
jgi:hypothetical protein